MTRDKVFPGVRALLEQVDMAGAPALETLPVAEARAAAIEALKQTSGPVEPVARVQDIQVPHSGRSVAVRVYTPVGQGPFPCLVYFHGGGWVVCDLNTHDSVCRAIARRADAVVVAVDYPISPENKFPAAPEACYAVIHWVSANAARLGIDARWVATGGDSAGGNLATVMCLMSRDRKGPPIALQIMIYPVTNLSSFETQSYSEFAEGYSLTRSEMLWFRDNYLARPEDACSSYASPLVAPDLSGLPPALVITAECDVLRDEGEAYARRLADASVEVTCSRYAGMIHPFYSLWGALPQGRRAIEQVAAALRGLRDA